MILDKTAFKVDEEYRKLEMPTAIVGRNYGPVHFNRGDYGDLHQEVRRITGHIATRLADNLWRTVIDGKRRYLSTRE